MNRPPHADVKWSYRDTSDGCEYATHYDGEWKVEVCDQDGDLSYWSVTSKEGAVAKGEVEDHSFNRCAFDVAMDTAIAALRAMQAGRHDDDH